MCPARAEYVRREMFSPHYLHLFRRYTPPLKVASDSWVCVKERFVSFSSLSPFGGSGAYRINDLPQFPPFEGSQQEIFITFPSSFASRHSSFLSIFRRYTPLFRHSNLVITLPLLGRGTGWGFSFFRLETPILPFLALLYYTMSQLLIYPFYTNRPRFV